MSNLIIEMQRTLATELIVLGQIKDEINESYATLGNCDEYWYDELRKIEAEIVESRIALRKLREESL